MARLKQIYGSIQFDVEVEGGILPLYAEIDWDGSIEELGIISEIDDGEIEAYGLGEDDLKAIGEKFVDVLRGLLESDIDILLES